MKTHQSTPFETSVRRRLSGWLVVSLGLAAWMISGCASSLSTPTSSNSAPTLVIAVQIPGGARPTPQQTAMIYQVLSTNPTLANYRFVDRTSDADFVLVAVYTPDALDPNQGNISVKDITSVNKVVSSRSVRSPTEMISSAQDSQQQLEAWARSRESVMPRP